MKDSFGERGLSLCMIFSLALTVAPTPAEAQVVVKVGPQYQHYRHHYPTITITGIGIIGKGFWGILLLCRKSSFCVVDNVCKGVGIETGPAD
jgi:hypothetical protein